MITSSKSSIMSLQRMQNKALRFALEEKYPNTRNTEELHLQEKVDLGNITIYDRAQNTKTRLLTYWKTQITKK